MQLWGIITVSPIFLGAMHIHIVISITALFFCYSVPLVSPNWLVTLNFICYVDPHLPQYNMHENKKIFQLNWIVRYNCQQIGINESPQVKTHLWWAAVRDIATNSPAELSSEWLAAIWYINDVMTFWYCVLCRKNIIVWRDLNEGMYNNIDVDW